MKAKVEMTEKGEVLYLAIPLAEASVLNLSKSGYAHILAGKNGRFVSLPGCIGKNASGEERELGLSIAVTVKK